MASRHKMRKNVAPFPRKRWGSPHPLWRPGYAALYQTGRLAVIGGARMERGLAALRQCLTQSPPQDAPPHSAAYWRIGVILAMPEDKVGARIASEKSLDLEPTFNPAIESLKKL